MSEIRWKAEEEREKKKKTETNYKKNIKQYQRDIIYEAERMRTREND